MNKYYYFKDIIYKYPSYSFENNIFIIDSIDYKTNTYSYKYIIGTFKNEKCIGNIADIENIIEIKNELLKFLIKIMYE